MRVLFLTHRIPYPPNKGDKIRSFNMLRYLAARHEVHLATIIDDAADLPGLAQLSPYATRILHARIDQVWRKPLAAVWAMLCRRSISICNFYSRTLQSELDALLGRLRFDVVLCFSSPMAEYVFRSGRAADIGAATRLMDLIDVDSSKWAQYADSTSPWISWLYRYESRTLAAYEQRIAEEFERVFVVSEQELAMLPAGSISKARAVSNGVDLDYFSPSYRPAMSPPEPTIVFTGVMDYWPNVDGVKWFAEEVLPIVRRSVPTARFYIVGSRPSRQVRRLEQLQGVTVTGRVDDVREYVAAAGVCVAPLRIARGIQNKVLEAMAMSKAVVATPEAFEGIAARPGEELVVAHGEQQFADAVVSLLTDRATATRIGERARRCMEERYSWPRCLEALGL